jgi:M-phase inducer tyrosine phosphatase
MNGLSNKKFTELRVIDCRFKYEFNGGHILNAININSKNNLREFIQTTNFESVNLLVLHCEFSQQRGPAMYDKFLQFNIRAGFILECQKKFKGKIPRICILDGGYAGFFKEFSNMCTPSSYTMMNDKAFSLGCKEGVRAYSMAFPKLKM